MASAKSISFCPQPFFSDLLDKVWTSHEMETYRRAAVERRKKVLPVLCGIAREIVDKEQPSLANVVMSDMAKGIAQVARELALVLGRGAPTIASVPAWMDPVHRFLTGHGELLLRMRRSDGPATPQASTIWELLAFPQKGEYPLFLDGTLYTHRHLLWCAAGAFFHNPHLAQNMLSADSLARLELLFREYLPEYRRDPEIVAVSGYPGEEEAKF